MIHSFDGDVAVVVGSKEAVILSHMYWWIKKNEANGKNFHDGFYWTYNSISAFSEIFPFWTTKVIRSTLDKLEADGYIITGNYNKVTYDRTKWYALTEKAFALLGKWSCPTGQMDFPDKANGFSTEGEPIPVLNHSKNSNNKMSSKPDYAKEREEIIKYLNEKAGKAYRPNTSKTKTFISARLKEGFTVDDFKTVIDKKCADWMNSEWDKYLRPETLFSPKFEGYLNEGMHHKPEAIVGLPSSDDGFYME